MAGPQWHGNKRYSRSRGRRRRRRRRTRTRRRASFYAALSKKMENEEEDSFLSPPAFTLR